MDSVFLKLSVSSCFLFSSFWAALWRMKFLGQESDLSYSCNLPQCWILNPLCWAGDRTCIPARPKHCC